MGKIKQLFLVSIVALVLVACTDDDNVSEEITGDIETSNGGDLTVAIPSDAISMDPHGNNDVPSEQVRDEIYEPLITLDDNLELVPLLAEEWEEIDETTWEFSLREGVTFHD